MQNAKLFHKLSIVLFLSINFEKHEWYKKDNRKEKTLEARKEIKVVGERRVG